VRGRALNVGDLVLCLVQSNKDYHKLSLLWKGPYVVTEVPRLGTCKLKTIDGQPSQHMEYLAATSLLPLVFSKLINVLVKNHVSEIKSTFPYLFHSLSF
jgi:hypothetical protein